MTEQDRDSFAELLIGLGETYGEAVSDMRMEIYYRALEDLSLPEVLTAANTHVRVSKFFPRPAELREAVSGSVDDQAELAWVHVQREVRRVGYLGTPTFPDLATQRAALELYGGWRALCTHLPASGPELLGFRKQFVATFRTYASKDSRMALPDAVVGMLES